MSLVDLILISKLEKYGLLEDLSETKGITPENQTILKFTELLLNHPITDKCLTHGLMAIDKLIPNPNKPNPKGGK